MVAALPVNVVAGALTGSASTNITQVGGVTVASTNSTGVIPVGPATTAAITHQTTQLTDTNETTIVTGVSAQKHNLVCLVLTNATATAVTVTIKDSTAGTTRMVLNLAASGGAVICPMTPIPQLAAAASNWTATLSAGSITVSVFAMWTVS